LTTPDAGSITYFDNLSMPLDALAIKSRLGVVAQMDTLDPDFTAEENLLVYGRYFGMKDRDIKARIAPLLEFGALTSKAKAKPGELSGGMKRRLSLARALINQPQMLMLDEPTTGLDPQARHLMWERLQMLMQEGKSILLTTHFMDEAERLCDRLLVIDHGKKNCRRQTTRFDCTAPRARCGGAVWPGRFGVGRRRFTAQATRGAG
jgi:lipooligosaccharide transport system ATP-binding protein